jgi:hypothetical protein
MGGYLMDNLSCSIKKYKDKSWFFLDEDNSILFTVVIEYPEGKTLPEELVRFIDLYAQGYREKDDE